MSKALVSLVGAGPGDRELISLKGWRRLQEADIVFYDFLVNERLLNACREDCQTVYVGKSANQHHYTQKRIIEVLIKAAEEGKHVVRLKGGDSFVFGRGGEEVLALKEKALPFEIVPGITAAVAGPAYAGIPLTHREFSLSCTFVTGHEAANREESQIDWSNLADNLNTLIFYMGMKNISSISENLISYGRSANTPVIVIQNASWGNQRSVEGTLHNIAEKVQKAKITHPAIIVVGSVSKLRQAMQWFEKLPHFGKIISWIGRFNSHEKELDHLEQLGARVVELPILNSHHKTILPRFRANLLIQRAESDYLIIEDDACFKAYKKSQDGQLNTKWLQQFHCASFDQKLIKTLKDEFGIDCQLIHSIEDIFQPI